MLKTRSSSSAQGIRVGAFATAAPPPTWRIALNLLDQNPHQPRSQMDEGALARSPS
jgi:hypothetical protein